MFGGREIWRKSRRRWRSLLILIYQLARGVYREGRKSEEKRSSRGRQRWYIRFLFCQWKGVGGECQ